ncbi:hypothetical protein KM043_001935 [Ampulex compressa]|nr:hypothetical protein KM043_001935 [Ampulex compressa]
MTALVRDMCGLHLPDREAARRGKEDDDEDDDCDDDVEFEEGEDRRREGSEFCEKRVSVKEQNHQTIAVRLNATSKFISTDRPTVFQPFPKEREQLSKRQSWFTRATSTRPDDPIRGRSSRPTASRKIVRSSIAVSRRHGVEVRRSRRTRRYGGEVKGRFREKRDLFPWEKVPFVPRPSLVPDPFTVWGRKKQDPKKEFYQYATIKEKEGAVRGKNLAKEEHKRQLVEGGTVSKVGLDAAAELAAKGHVFEKGVLSRQPGANRHAVKPATGRTKILMALQTPSWYRF